jgi:hypothetical protein
VTTPASTPLPDRRLKRIERLGYLLDNAIRIPGTRYRIGFDALIGLLPGFGDLAGAAFSAYIVLEAARYALPNVTLLRMVSNIALEVVVGAVPLLGDLFDASWKANARNLSLLKAHLGSQGTRQRRADRRLMAAILFGLLLLLIGLGAALYWLGGVLLRLGGTS